MKILQNRIAALNSFATGDQAQQARIKVIVDTLAAAMKCCSEDLIWDRSTEIIDEDVYGEFDPFQGAVDADLCGAALYAAVRDVQNDISNFFKNLIIARIVSNITEKYVAEYRIVAAQAGPDEVEEDCMHFMHSPEAEAVAFALDCLGDGATASDVVRRARANIVSSEVEWLDAKSFWAETIWAKKFSAKIIDGRLILN